MGSLAMLTRNRLADPVVGRLHAPAVEYGSSDTLLVHILFLDLVGYSKLTNEQQECAAEQLVADVKLTLAYQRGIERGNLTCLDTGDGMALVFEGDPLAPAFAALELANTRGPEPKRPLRMGLHSGPVMRVFDINNRTNFKGVGINVAQRVMDCAISGQIVMTEHFASILASYDGWSSLLLERGTHRAKHGLKLRVCELKHEYSPRLLSAEVIRRHIKISPIMRLLKLILFVLAWLSSLWVAEQLDNGSERAGNWGEQMNAGVNKIPAP